jgi:hypothetical protein
MQIPLKKRIKKYFAKCTSFTKREIKNEEIMISIESHLLEINQRELY